MDQKQRIEVAKQKVDRAKTARTVAETQKIDAETRAEEVKKEMQLRGVTPETIEDKIKELEQEVETNLAKAEQLLPGA